MEGRGDGGGLRDRRQFTVEMALALLGGAAVTIGCGGGASPSGPGPVAPAPTPVPTPSNFGTVTNNHGHQAVITAAQLLAGDALRLDIIGGAPHNHLVELSADEVVRVRNREVIEKESSETEGLLGLHRHVVRFN